MICGERLNEQSRPCQREDTHVVHWTPSDHAGKPFWWKTNE